MMTRRPAWRRSASLRRTVPMFAIAAIVSATVDSPAAADEAFICDGGRIAYVATVDLEDASRKDPCVAAYMARRVGVARPPLRDTVANKRSVTVQASAPPVPLRHPLRAEGIAPAVLARAAAGVTTGSIVAPHAAPIATARKATATVTPVVFKHASRAHAERSPVADAPVDFRNVSILNAAPGQATHFYHAR